MTPCGHQALRAVALTCLWQTSSNRVTAQTQNLKGELDYCGRKSVRTIRIKKEKYHHAIPVLGTVSCGPGDYEEENILEYIRMPETLIGKGEFFALIAKGHSMNNLGIYDGDYVIIRKQNTANTGDVVVALTIKDVWNCVSYGPYTLSNG